MPSSTHQLIAPSAGPSAIPSSRPAAHTAARVGRWSALALILLAALSTARLSAQDDPRFLIETIIVTGHRRPATVRIVVAESRLKVGESYGENELREAIYRIRRLPFVVDADFALHRGSRRGAYELAITIEQTTPVFLSYDLEGLSALEDSNGHRTLHAVDSGSLGVREFVGAGGLAFASIDKDAKSYTAGYTQYDPFGRGSFVSLSVLGSRDGHDLAPMLSVGTPLSGNQSLRADLSWERSDFSAEGFTTRTDLRDVELSWIYDTTDDPLFPSRGLRLTAGPFYQSANTETREGLLPSGSERIVGLDASAARYWPLSARQSLGLLGSLVRQRQTVATAGLRLGPLDEYTATLALIHSVSLWSGERTRRFGDLRWQTSAMETVNHPGGLNGTAFTLQTGLAFRSTWAVIHLGTVATRNQR